MFGGFARIGPDICYFTDASPRGRAVAELSHEIEAAAEAGYKSILHPLQDRAAGLHPAVADLLRRGKIEIAAVESPVGSVRLGSVRLAVFHEPMVEQTAQLPAGLVPAEKAVVVLHRPVFDSTGKSRADIQRVIEEAKRLTGAEPLLAPAWASVRRQLTKIACPCPVLAEDWSPIIASGIAPGKIRRARRAPRGLRPLVGRFAVDHPENWPGEFDDLIQLFPLSDHFDVRLCGVPSRLLEKLYGGTPSNWIFYPADSLSSERFLGACDFFLHAWHKNWPHAMDFAILQAMAAGVVPVLPPNFAPLFGTAAIHARPGWQAIRQISLAHRDEDRFAELLDEGARWLSENAGPDRLVRRLARLINGPATGSKNAKSARPPARFLAPSFAPRPASADRPQKTVIFSATNGIGLGHLTQLLAIAKRLPGHIQPVFATMSQAVSIVREAGYTAHYFPDYRYSDSRFQDWTRWLEAEIGDLIDLYDAQALVFDGVMPYEGIVRAGARRGCLPMVWVRIPMWKRATWDDSVERAKYFDLVLDTGEIAQARNIGARIPYADRLEVIPPMLLCDEAELLDRRTARARLGLDAKRPAVLLQLGAGNNQELAPLLDQLLAALERIGDFQVVNAEWLIAEHGLDAWPKLKILRGFPNALFYRAFDFVVSAVGYNTFHELIAYRIPCLFVPNENVMTDDQLGRARFAEEAGLGFCLRAQDLELCEPLLARLADDEERRRISARCGAFSGPNGAEVAAQRIATLLDTADAGEGQVLEDVTE